MVLDDHLTGPHIHSLRLTDDTYLNFVQEELSGILEEIISGITLLVYARWCTRSFNINILNHLYIKYPNRSISRWNIYVLDRSISNPIFFFLFWVISLFQIRRKF